ncbi:MAG: hypothetical protein H7329_00570 [Opitutaceae bacterium]|nr:hypothetical protein [Cytophagales bacterium]
MNYFTKLNFNPFNFKCLGIFILLHIFINHSYGQTGFTYKDSKHQLLITEPFTTLSAPPSIIVRNIAMPTRLKLLRSFVKKAELKVSLEKKIGEIIPLSSCAIDVEYKITAVRSLGVSEVLSNAQKLSLKAGSNGGTIFIDLTSKAFLSIQTDKMVNGTGYFDFDALKIEITKITAPACFSSYINLISTTVSINIEYGIDLLSSTDAEIAAGSLIFPRSNPVNPPTLVTTKNLKLTWNCNKSMIDFECPKYQIQILKLYNSDKLNVTDPLTIDANPDWNKALNIFTESSQTSVEITLGEGQGYYAWRVRPISTFYPDEENGDIYNDQAFSKWPYELVYMNTPTIPITSSAEGVFNVTGNTAVNKYIFYFKDPDDQRNYTYSRTFSEGNKAKEILTYANGLLQVQQQQTYIPSLKSRLVSQTLYDNLGRPALVSLPLPTNFATTANPAVSADDKLYAYENRVLKTTSGGLYTLANFDADNKILNPDVVSSSASNKDKTLDNYSAYYSNNNTDINVPSADQYTFSRTLYDNDPSGRVKEQSSPGLAHSINTDINNRKATVRTEYATATKAELVRLLGKEAPLSEKVLKTITTDQNNVKSATYTNSVGKVIITCLIFDNNSNNLANLDEYKGGVVGTGEINSLPNADINKNAPAPVVLTDVITVNKKDELGLIASKRIVLTQQQDLSVSYTFGTKALSGCDVPGNPCKYDLHVYIKDVNDPTKSTYLIQGIDASTCNPCTSKVNLMPGTYVIEKILRPVAAVAVATADGKSNDFMEIIGLFKTKLAEVKCPEQAPDYYMWLTSFVHYFNAFKAQDNASVTPACSGITQSLQPFLDKFQITLNAYNDVKKITLNYDASTTYGGSINRPPLPNSGPTGYTSGLSCAIFDASAAINYNTLFTKGFVINSKSVTTDYMNAINSLTIFPGCCEAMTVPIKYVPPVLMPTEDQLKTSRNNTAKTINYNFFSSTSTTTSFPDLEGYALSLLADYDVDPSAVVFKDLVQPTYDNAPNTFRKMSYNNYLLEVKKRIPIGTYGGLYETNGDLKIYVKYFYSKMMGFLPGDFNNLANRMLYDKYDASNPKEVLKSGEANTNITPFINDPKCVDNTPPTSVNISTVINASGAPLAGYTVKSPEYKLAKYYRSIGYADSYTFNTGTKIPQYNCIACQDVLIPTVNGSVTTFAPKGPYLATDIEYQICQEYYKRGQQNANICSQYQWQPVFNCWNQIVNQMVMDLAEAVRFSEGSDQSKIQDAVAEQDGNSEDSDGQFDDALPKSKFLRWILKISGVLDVSDLARDSDNGSMVAANSPPKDIIPECKVSTFLGCTGYKFARIISTSTPLALPGDEDYNTGVFSKPRLNTDVSKSRFASKFGTGTTADGPFYNWGALAYRQINPAADGTAGCDYLYMNSLFPYIKHPWYAFKYFEYPYEGLDKSLENSVCYSDPNDCFISQGGVQVKVPCCLNSTAINSSVNWTTGSTSYGKFTQPINTILTNNSFCKRVSIIDEVVVGLNSPLNNYTDANLSATDPNSKAKLVVANFDGKGQFLCRYTKNEWNSGQRYGFYEMIKNKNFATVRVDPYPLSDATATTDFANKLPAFDPTCGTSSISKLGLTAGEQQDWFSWINQTNTASKFPSRVEFELMKKQKSCESTCFGRKAAFRIELEKHFTKNGYKVGACVPGKNADPAQYIDPTDLDAMTESFYKDQCLPLCKMSSYRVNSESARYFNAAREFTKSSSTYPPVTYVAPPDNSDKCSPYGSALRPPATSQECAAFVSDNSQLGSSTTAFTIEYGMGDNACNTANPGTVIQRPSGMTAPAAPAVALGAIYDFSNLYGTDPSAATKVKNCELKKTNIVFNFEGFDFNPINPYNGTLTANNSLNLNIIAPACSSGTWVQQDMSTYIGNPNFSPPSANKGGLPVNIATDLQDKYKTEAEKPKSQTQQLKFVTPAQ